MRAKLLVAAMAALLGLGLAQSAAAGGWDDGSAASAVVYVPTAIYYPAHVRKKSCARHPRAACHAGFAPNAHPYTVYRYAGSRYPRYFYRLGGYGWNR